jgi:predicted alpha/beta-hydrolase family hydrolase
VVRFEFPYMAERRLTGKKKPPGSPQRLLDCWRAVVEARGAGELVIGGKSMGGRLASMVADELEVRGLVCLGYPFHPPGRPESLRTEHLASLRTPALFIQGERDALGNREQVAAYDLSEQIRLKWLADGDHSFKPRVKSGHTLEQNLQAAIGEIRAFIQQL